MIGHKLFADKLNCQIELQINWTAWKITWNVAELSRLFFIFFLFLVWIADFYTGSAKSNGSCPLDNILSNGYLANHCLCFWTTNCIHLLAVHWISSCPVDNFIQWIILSSILNNRAFSFNLFYRIKYLNVKKN
jgi:hypothetical protein